MHLQISHVAVLVVLLCATASARAQYHPLAVGDFNGDGIDDLAIGVPEEDIGPVVDAGAVNVIYGTANKLRAAGNQFWHQNKSGIAETAEEDDLFGKALAAGDFNNDGFDDLAIGVPDESVGGVLEAGAVHVLYGSSTGLRAAGSQLWSQNSSGIKDVAEEEDFFGVALTVGDFNGDGFADLAIGVSDEDVGSVVNAGAVNVIYGSSNGLRASGNQFWHQDSSGIRDTAETDDFWGFVLAAGDFNGDGRDDLAVTSSDEDINGVNEAGAINVIYGTANGLRASGNQFWHQDSSGILNSAQGGEFFGGTLCTGDFNNDGFDDLVTGMQLESVMGINIAGAVAVIYGSANGLRASGNQFWTQNSAGVPDSAEGGDYFGSAVAAGDFNGDGFDDLAIGSLGENFFTGAVFILYGSASRLTSTNSQYFDQNSTGIEDTAEQFDEFGSALVTGRFNSGNKYDLAIGIPGESIGAIAKAGAVAVLYGSATGITSTGDQFWHQDRAGIADSCEADDSFGGIVTF